MTASTGIRIIFIVIFFDVSIHITDDDSAVAAVIPGMGLETSPTVEPFPKEGEFFLPFRSRLFRIKLFCDTTFFCFKQLVFD